MARIEPFHPQHLPQLAALVNTHLGAVVPGWAVPEAFLASRLERDPRQFVVGPWVTGRLTLCAIERDRLVAAAQLLRYGDGPEVSDAYKGVGEIGWLVAWPAAATAAAELLAAAVERLEAWGSRHQWADPAGLYVPDLSGVPDCWPHLAAVLREAGFRPDPEREEAIWGGPLGGVSQPGPAPVDGLRVGRRVAESSTRLAAVLDTEAIGVCDVDLDPSMGGTLPALRGWADGWNLQVEPAWRNRGVGAWLVRHAAAWARLGGCDRILFPVEAAGEAAGADRFYRRFGWDVLARLERAWAREPAP